MYSVFEQKQQYCIRQVSHYDFPRQNAYQRLRAEIFVGQSGWDIPLDKRGRERDHYDEMDESSVQVACVYGKYRDTEHLLGGVRIHLLRNWDESMVVNEFSHTGMIPDSVVSLLKERYQPTELLEITRLCLRRGRTYTISGSSKKMPPFQLDVARDLIYAAIFAQLEQVQRKLILFIIDDYYRRIMRRSHFVFEELYFHREEGKRGYSLITLDFPATIFAIEEAGAYEQVQRVLSLCTKPITI